jgi:hypothetical protein
MKGKSSAQTSIWMAMKVVVVMNAGAGCSNHPSGTIFFQALQWFLALISVKRFFLPFAQ